MAESMYCEKSCGDRRAVEMDRVSWLQTHRLFVRSFPGHPNPQQGGLRWATAQDAV